MKIIYVNDKNANIFEKEAKHNKAFVKYFSPTCPACIAMENEWDGLCSDIENKYNTDLILAQMDPTGMESLGSRDIHTDVDYVPSLLLLENGKKTKEYNGSRNKDSMIEFLLEEGLIKSKTGGSKNKYNKRSKSNKKSQKGGKPTRRLNPNSLEKRNNNSKRIDSIAKISTDGFQENEFTMSGEPEKYPEFSFNRNKYWLKPFLIELLKGNNNPNTEYVLLYATNKVDSVFRNKGVTKSDPLSYKPLWSLCAKSINSKNEKCRISPGFNNFMVPKSRKYDPEYSNFKKSKELKSAQNSYMYLKHSDNIDDVIRTPMSDFTRSYYDGDFLPLLRKNMKNESNMFKAILDTYGYRPEPSMDDLKKSIKATKESMGELSETFTKMSEDPKERSKLPGKTGGRKKNKGLKISNRKRTMRKKNRRSCCIGKRDGKSGCRKCCKTRRNYTRCITRCMRGY